jgi:hypothetical protein
VTVLVAVFDITLAGIPRYRTEILLVPDGGGAEKLRVVPAIEYVVGSCVTPEIMTSIEAVFAGDTVKVKPVVDPLPENESVRNVAVTKGFPKYAILSYAV